MQIDHTKTTHSTLPLHTHRTICSAYALLASLVLMTASCAVAQNATVWPSVAPGVSAIFLPARVGIAVPEAQPSTGDFMGGARSSSPTSLPEEPRQRLVASIHTKYILPGMSAQPINARDKVIIGLKDSYSPMNFSGMFASAGYEQVRNGQPNYGTDRGAFGERLGAAAIRDTTQGVFTDAIFAPLLHEDPRYYIEGSQYGTLHRVLYAVSRPLISRTDSGRTTLNGALLLGYASSTLLTNTYYPAINRNVRDNVTGFGGSLGGAALGFLLSEFSSSLWHKMHLAWKQ
jgi:hypothetical protein